MERFMIYLSCFAAATSAVKISDLPPITHQQQETPQTAANTHAVNFVRSFFQPQEIKHQQTPQSYLHINQQYPQASAVQQQQELHPKEKQYHQQYAQQQQYHPQGQKPLVSAYINHHQNLRQQPKKYYQQGFVPVVPREQRGYLPGKFVFNNGRLLFYPDLSQQPILSETLGYPGRQLVHPVLGHPLDQKISRLYPPNVPPSNLAPFRQEIYQPKPTPVQPIEQTPAPKVREEQSEEREEEEEKEDVRNEEENAEEEEEDDEGSERYEEEEEEEEEVEIPKRPFKPSLTAGRVIFDREDEKEEEEDNDEGSSKVEEQKKNFSFYNPYVTPDGKYIYPKKYKTSGKPYEKEYSYKSSKPSGKEQEGKSTFMVYKYSKLLDDNPQSESLEAHQTQHIPISHTKKVIREKWYVSESTDEGDQ